MTYLSDKIDVLKKENAQLKEELFNKNKIISKRLVESEILNENKQLKKRISKLVYENTKLQNDLFTDQLETDESEHKISQLKTEIVDLKTEIVDHRVKEYRLTKILNETSDYT